ncbi:putative Rho GTPase activator [Taphrina deformans PYCC 5710]|uniref:Rho GTPase activator n=1 Tax=Taphrina deformans (strain PYCC 5710 / ATCC 11124 / CBS 356.35 / IMI 108563 / JCM 9778 / NBRC 8474) TaxID=1097556 RepID=R4XJN4_TAPDE|nr:putative Rho GTPase activator [Taphrina deformans PYCC 5710]|eukprot:CCG83560.1 putative Rho GTPase activator [Taphrina deformans PYCC 5710]
MASTASRNVVTEPSATEGLSSWWAKFKSRPAKKEPEALRGIFSVPLHESIVYANVAISLYNDDGQTFIYGYIPIVVAKCGLYLKDNATETEGIFRLSGSAKRIKDLQAIFDQPPKYGKGLDWTGFTVHDAANILRRYLNHLPDPIIPYGWYDSFREPLKNNWPTEKVIVRMQELVASLPPLNRQLLLYILDLLAVFASKSDINRMTSENLSAIFQPGLITHPRDDMAPQEYKLSQEVLVFLIDNQSHFLLDSLCSPAKEHTPAVSSQAKTSISRRRTLQAPRRSPSTQQRAKGNVEQTSSPTFKNNHSLASASTSRSGTLSRSNTVPTKRNPPTNTSATDITPRHVSTPFLGRNSPAPVGSSANSENPNIPAQRSQPVGSAPLLEVSTPQAQVRTDTTIDSARNSPRVVPSVYRGEGSSSRRNSQNSSLLATESEFSILSGRKGLSESHTQQPAPVLKSSTVLRPVSIAAAPATLVEKSNQNKHSKTTSSSPSKFSNLFKKKPRKHSVSSTSEAGSRRDLDK